MISSVFRLLTFYIVCSFILVSFAGCRSQKEIKSMNDGILASENTGKVSDKPLYVRSEPALQSEILTPAAEGKSIQTPKPATPLKSKEMKNETPNLAGNDLENTETNTEKKLKGIVVCIDAGHQRKVNYGKEPLAPGSSELKIKDPGGTSGVCTGVPEYKLNLKVSQKLKARLEILGAKVVMTRESDDVNLGNVDRANIANGCNANLFIRIHADGLDNPEVKGLSILIPGNRYVKDRKILADSNVIAHDILKCVLKTTGAKSRGVIERNDLTGFNWAKVPMILIEMGFMTNAGEDKLLNSDDYQNKIVKGISQGLIDYFG